MDWCFVGWYVEWVVVCQKINVLIVTNVHSYLERYLFTDSTYMYACQISVEIILFSVQSVNHGEWRGEVKEGTNKMRAQNLELGAKANRFWIRTFWMYFLRCYTCSWRTETKIYTEKKL